jgi:deoxyribonuclease-4
MATHWIFGPAELPDKRGFKVSFEKLRELKYKALQISMANETLLDAEKAEEVAELNRKYPVHLSVHAPYHCFITHSDRALVKRSITDLVECARLTKIIGGEFVVVHPGLLQGRAREDVFAVVEDNLMLLADLMEDAEIDGITFHVENISRANEFGQFEDTLRIAQMSDIVLPCIDWSHVQACRFGALRRQSHFDEVVQAAMDAIGKERLERSSWHYADTEHRDGVERQHLNFGEGDVPLRMIVKAIEDAGLSRCVMVSECPGEPNHQLIYAQLKKYSVSGTFG